MSTHLGVKCFLEPENDPDTITTSRNSSFGLTIDTPLTTRDFLTCVIFEFLNVRSATLFGYPIHVPLRKLNKRSITLIV